jgi:hypothetical protein
MGKVKAQKSRFMVEENTRIWDSVQPPMLWSRHFVGCVPGIPGI